PTMPGWAAGEAPADVHRQGIPYSAGIRFPKFWAHRYGRARRSHKKVPIEQLWEGVVAADVAEQKPTVRRKAVPPLSDRRRQQEVLVRYDAKVLPVMESTLFQRGLE